MAAFEQRTFIIPSKQTAFIDGQVASGAFESASEVVHAGLRALQERDAATESWLQEEVAGIYDTMKADPSRAMPAGSVFADLRVHHALRVKAGA